MGRKRSKTQKKKQCKAKGGKLAKVFAKKLGVGDVDTKMRIETTSTTTPDSSSGILSPRKKTRTCSQKLMAKLSREKSKKASAAAAAASSNGDEGTTTTTSGGSAPHVRDFLRQQASLREREMRIEWKRNVTRKFRNNGGNKISIKLTPASFAATDAEKSVDQLVQETTHSVGNWNGLEGGSGNDTPRKQLPNFSTPFSTPISQSAPEAAAWSPDAVATVDNNANPWAVLADDDDDNGGNPRNNPQDKNMTVALLPPPSIPVSQAFSFAPPSFTTFSTTTRTTTAFAAAAAAHNGDEIDADDL
mmetsp:Transcript_3311/g.6902  ORF Transcript_3311/g.6902 Transcript_3311/m.6902 type:complete len:303 (-) Transcript_3311:186-1094(-)|eukprot:CAMPEP_0168743524 /NCGR_PEP_ID=MMETSP0724-20121128/13622_1 /TAXON_ID=265536 /ORGANISM="Amphiprora sp., Strain CCMP467" /LENGTH=302 /DNA_ID=CAMNT_0008791159 /DNA_START=189 /DNA_END=1097 /DNA_ORIENTATION=-